MLDQSSLQYPNVWPAPLNVMHTTKINTLPVQRGYTYLQTFAAKRRNHLSNENLKTLFFLAALKLPAKNLYEYEQKIKVVKVLYRCCLLCINNICFIFVLLHATSMRFWHVKSLGNLGA